MVREDEARLRAGPQRIGNDEGMAIGRQLVEGIPSVEGGPCAEAWAAREHAHERGLGAAPGDARARREFLEACRALPEAQQACLSPRYLRDHAEECSAQMQQIARRMERERGVDLPEFP